MKKNFNIILVLLVVSVILSCSKDEVIETKSFEELHNENGVPVTVKEIEPEIFDKELSFNAEVTGKRESYASAMIGGKIEKIHVNVGDYVEKDAIIMEFPEDVPAAKYMQAKSALNLAKDTYKRMKKVFEAGGISQHDLNKVETQYEVALADFDAASQLLKVRAPISGYVTNLGVKETDNVSAETVLATISNTDKMKARVWASEDEICHIKKGMNARVEWREFSFEGTVRQTAVAMDPMRNSFAVDIVFDNTDNMCKSGVLGQVSITVYKNEKARVIPRKITNDDDKGDYVYVVNGQKAEKRYIEIGQVDSDIEVVSGLDFGDKVIVKGLNQIDDGNKIKIVK